MKKEHIFFTIDSDYFNKKDSGKKNNCMHSECSYSIVEVDGYEFPVYRKEITSANIIEAIAGTTGYQGGDSGHGCRAFIRIKDLASTDIRITKIEPYGDGVEIILGGDTEVMTMIEALHFIADVLEKEAGNYTNN